MSSLRAARTSGFATLESESAGSTVAPMSNPRFTLTLNAAQGKLYAVGGTAGDDNGLATAESYDPQQDRWEAAAPLSSARCCHAMVVM